MYLVGTPLVLHLPILYIYTPCLCPASIQIRDFGTDSLESVFQLDYLLFLISSAWEQVWVTSSFNLDDTAPVVSFHTYYLPLSPYLQLLLYSKLTPDSVAHSHGWKVGSPPHHCLQEAAWASSQYGNWLSPQLHPTRRRLHIKKTKEGVVMLLWPGSGSHVSAYPLHSIVNLGQPWLNVKGTIQRARIPGDKDHWGNLEG